MEVLRRQSHLGGRKWQQPFETCFVCSGFMFPRVPSLKGGKREFFLKIPTFLNIFMFPKFAINKINPLSDSSSHSIIPRFGQRFCSVFNKDRSPEKGKWPSVAVPKVGVMYLGQTVRIIAIQFIIWEISCVLFYLFVVWVDFLFVFVFFPNWQCRSI